MNRSALPIELNELFSVNHFTTTLFIVEGAKGKDSPGGNENEPTKQDIPGLPRRRMQERSADSLWIKEIGFPANNVTILCIRL
jgi:hypothetical protein